VVYAKELRDALRDRRTALMIFVSSIVMGPLMLVLVVQWVAGLEEKAALLKVRMAGAEHAPQLVNFLHRNDIEIEVAPTDYEARVRDGRMDAVIVVPEDFDERMLAGDSATVEILYDDSRTESAPSIRQAERLLRAFNRETGTLRLVARGVSPELADPVKVERVNTATPRQKGAFLLFLIPMFAILSPLVGGMTVAIDSTAGERERGSLEPLLANPVRASRFALGKWLASWTLGSVVAALTLSGFVLAAVAYAQRKKAALAAFGAAELVQFLVVIVPFSAMISAVQLLICAYGRTYREAQTYLSFMFSAVTMVPMIVLFSGLKDAFWQLAVPVLGQQTLLSRIMRGDAIGWSDYLLPAAVAAAIAIACLAAVSHLLRQERIVFGR